MVKTILIFIGTAISVVLLIVIGLYQPWATNTIEGCWGVENNEKLLAKMTIGHDNKILFESANSIFDGELIKIGTEYIMKTGPLKIPSKLSYDPSIEEIVIYDEGDEVPLQRINCNSVLLAPISTKPNMTRLEFEHSSTGMGAGLRLEITVPEPYSVCHWKEWRSTNSKRPIHLTTRSNTDSGHVRYYDYEPWGQYVVEASCKAGSGTMYNVDHVELKNLAEVFNPNE